MILEAASSACIILVALVGWPSQTYRIKCLLRYHYEAHDSDEKVGLPAEWSQGSEPGKEHPRREHWGPRPLEGYVKKPVKSTQERQVFGAKDRYTRKIPAR